MPGEFMSIVGPSGSGKSTMLGLLGVLDLPTAGTDPGGRPGREPARRPTRSKLRGNSIGFVFQQFHLIPHLTAMGNVETALLYRDIRPKERQERAYAALERLGLGARADHRPVQLSGGEQQRVALARAIVTDPLMILADEPTGALDSVNAAHVLEIFRGLAVARPGRGDGDPRPHRGRTPRQASMSTHARRSRSWPGRAARVSPSRGPT